MTTAKTIILIAGPFVAVGLAIGVKMVFFPSAKDGYFSSQRSLARAPAGIADIRPTHFEHSVNAGVTWARAESKAGRSWRVMGRDVTLRDMIAAAYGETVGRVQLPFDAPTNSFDFIMTTSTPRRSLQKALRRTLGYTVQTETNDTDVLALKVVDPSLPGLTVSGPGEKEDSKFRNGKMYVTHTRLIELASDFEWIIKSPVTDETGLTNYYDLSLNWNKAIFMQLQTESTARPALDKILKDWGLALEPDTAPIEVLVVKKVY